MISGLSESLTLTLVLILVFGSVCLYLYTRLTHAEQKISLIESILLDLKMASDLRSFERASEDSDDNPVSHTQAHAPSSKSFRTDEMEDSNSSTEDHRDINTEYEEYRDVLQSARSALRDNIPTASLDESEPVVVSIAETVQEQSLATGSPSPIQSIETMHQESKELSTEAQTSVSMAAPFEATDVPFESLDQVVGNTNQGSRAPQPNLESLTAKELHALAKQRGIVGESKMTRAQLIDELSRQSTEAL